MAILGAVAALILPALVQTGAPAAGANIVVQVGTFANGNGEAILAFPAAGVDSTMSLSFQTGMVISSAFFNVSGAPFTAGGLDCPEMPSVDLGSDGNLEWCFNGTGYGSLGHQYMFSDGNLTAGAVFGPSGGTAETASVRLPAKSAISGASVVLTPSAFSGLLNVSLDIGDDGLVDWASGALSSATAITALESVFSAYISAAVPNGTDIFNISYVDVPVRLSCGSAATLALSGLGINYTRTFTTRDLASELDALVPDAAGTGNVSIPVRVSSASPGRLRISGLGIRAQPPVHPVSLQNPLPAPDQVMDENTSLEFGCTPVDIYGNPFTVQWYLDDWPVPGANGASYTFSANWSSSGRHMVMVSAQNGLAESQFTWIVTVTDIDRPPVVDSFAPASGATVAEQSTIVFNVSASDPDGDVLTYSWTLDGRKRPEASQTMSYHPAYGAVGQHVVEVTVADSRGLWTSMAWCVTVLKTNMPPVIASFTPAGDATIEEGEQLALSIAATDINGDTVAYSWTVDGYHAADGMQFNYTPGYGDSGTREIMVVATDGEFTVLHSWNVTVTDVRRPPVAVLESPLEGAVYLDTDRIRLAAPDCHDPDGDVLNLTWSDGDVVLGNGRVLNVSLARGTHAIRLVVDDGTGCRDTASANITVRMIRLNFTARISPRSPVIGEKIKIAVNIISAGDAPASNVSLEFFADGVPSGSRVWPVVEPGANLSHIFSWKAERGTHEMLLVAGNQSITFNVRGAEPVSEMFYPTVLVLLALILSVGTAAGYFTYLAVKGPLARPRRARRTLKTPWYWLGTRISEVFDRIRVEGTPFKDRPIVIQTEIPDGLTTDYLMSQQLTAKRKWWLRKPPHEKNAPAAPPPEPGMPPGTPAPQDEGAGPGAAEGAFSSSTAPLAVPVENGKGEPGEAQAREGEEPAGPKKPRKRIKDIEDRVLALERKGADVASARRFLSLARSFWKGGNSAKADLYFEKAEQRLAELEEDVRGIPLCPNCGATVDPAWTACPECETKLQ